MDIAGIPVASRAFLAPMSGVTDIVMRRLAARSHAGIVVSEMVASDEFVRGSEEARIRAEGEGVSPHVVQLAGCDPYWMGEAARLAEANGADIVDINMDCPAKKVCNKWAGSALMQDEALAIQIVEAVVAACAPHGVPVTLKMRTGWCASAKNAPVLARAAESAGIALLTVHGRTREQGYKGFAEHDTVAHIKSVLRIPVVANGDIDSPERALAVLRQTGADAIMIGRAAQGRPWLFREIAHYLETGTHLAPPTAAELRAWLLEHLEDHYALYGEYTGVRTARKHLGWYARSLPGGPAGAAAFRERINALESCEAQLQCVNDYFDQQQEDWKLAA